MDADLLAIRELYRKLAALRYSRRAGRREPPEYTALIAQIRALVDARTKRRGNEMIAVISPCRHD